jgi:hypothetical protein
MSRGGVGRGGRCARPCEASMALKSRMGLDAATICPELPCFAKRQVRPTGRGRGVWARPGTFRPAIRV